MKKTKPLQEQENETISLKKDENSEAKRRPSKMREKNSDGKRSVSRKTKIVKEKVKLKKDENSEGKRKA